MGHTFIPVASEVIDLSSGDYAFCDDGTGSRRSCDILNTGSTDGTVVAKLKADSHWLSYFVPAGTTVAGEFKEVRATGTTPATGWALRFDFDRPAT